MGSIPFAGLVAELLLLSHALTVLLSGALALAWPAMSSVYLRTCAVGFSAVLFGLKVRYPSITCSTDLAGPSTCRGVPWASVLCYLGSRCEAPLLAYTTNHYTFPVRRPGVHRDHLSDN
jgi:hypothetical protein